MIQLTYRYEHNNQTAYNKEQAGMGTNNHHSFTYGGFMD